MTEAAADLGLSGGAAGGDAPQPELSVSQAWSRRAELMRDPDFRARLDSHDPAARAESERLMRGIMKGHSFDFGANVNAAAFGPGGEAALADREALAREQAVEHVRARADIPDAVLEQIRQGTPVTAREYQLAVEQRRRLFDDKGWVEKYLNGDRACRTQMTLCEVIIASRVEG
jgi:hypothetical protein